MRTLIKYWILDAETFEIASDTVQYIEHDELTSISNRFHEVTDPNGAPKN